MMKTLFITFILTLAIVGIALLFMCVRILLKHGGRFHAQHIGQSPAMRKRGITCVQSMDKEMRMKRKPKI